MEPNSETEPNALTLDVLAKRCKEESRVKQQNRDDRFCYELVRRAFGGDDHAFTRIFEIYITTWSAGWIRDAQAFESSARTADDFKSESFYSCYQHIKSARNDPKGFDAFPTMSAFLTYLRIALVRTVAGYLRSLKTKPTHVQNAVGDDEDDLLEGIASEENTSATAERNVAWRQVEQYIYELLEHEDNRTLFNCWAKQGMSRAEIAALFPEKYPDVNAVRVALQRMRRRLYKDNALRELLEGLM